MHLFRSRALENAMPHVLATARFRVAALVPISRQIVGPDGTPQVVHGVSVRAVPVEKVEGEWGRLDGWFANTPASQVGFSIFGAAAKQFHAGFVFDAPLITAE